MNVKLSWCQCEICVYLPILQKIKPVKYFQNYLDYINNEGLYFHSITTSSECISLNEKSPKESNG